MSPKRVSAPLASIFITTLVGILIAVQLRTQAQSQTAPEPSERIAMMKQVLIETEKARAELQQEVAELRQRLIASNLDEINGKASALTEENLQLRQFAGLTAVTGPGMVISVTALSTPKHPNNTVKSLHLLLLVNELRAGGAEAIAINEQRLVTNSEIRDAGSYILVNLTRISPPYVIKAIGDPDMLEKTLLMRNGIVDDFARKDIAIQPIKQSYVQIPAWDGAIRHRYAEPDKRIP